MKRLSLTRRKARTGFCFCLPFLIGFVCFFLGPVIQSVVYAFSSFRLVPGGMEKTFVGLENFRRAFMVDLDYVPALLSSLTSMPVQLIFILIFSFFIANVLNQKFHGRALMRAIFFLPVIITSGVLYQLQTGNQLLGMANTTLNSTPDMYTDALNLSESLGDMLYTYFQFGPQFFEYIQLAVSQIYFITISSGVQILIFLAGLQTISPSVYEAAAIEGATGWESFWKITFPMMSPMILVGAVYTVIDILGGPSNGIMARCFTLAFPKMEFGFSLAMMWFYLVIIFAVLAIVGGIVSRFVYYEERT